MLKRQRPASPPPFVNHSVSAPLESPDIDMQATRIIKRRRVTPPSLDGSLRGWADPPSIASEDEQWDDADDAEPSLFPQDVSTYPIGYEATNKLLHDLHISHQIRLARLYPSSPQPLCQVDFQAPHGHVEEHVHSTKQTLPPPTVAQPVDHSGSSATITSCGGATYEDVNRSLREAFLNRRRELHS